jgi:hypothetical protein
MEITLFFPFVIKTPKREKSYEAHMRSRLLVVLRILIVVGPLLIIVIVGRNMSRANAESSQLVRSKRAVRARDGREDRDVGKL